MVLRAFPHYIIWHSLLETEVESSEKLFGFCCLGHVFYCTAVAFRQSLSSSPLYLGRLQWLANASPREGQLLHLASSAILFFLKSQYPKISEIGIFPLCTALRFLLPVHPLTEVFQKQEGCLMCTSDCGSVCCYTVAAPCLTKILGCSITENSSCLHAPLGRNQHPQ